MAVDLFSFQFKIHTMISQTYFQVQIGIKDGDLFDLVYTFVFFLDCICLFDFDLYSKFLQLPFLFKM